MEESHPPATAESPQSGEMSQQKLMQKCKNLLTIAQKAKTARDEALQERAKLEEELEKAKETIIQKDQQAKNFQEIMGVLTDQKLKLAMDIDTLKKEKTTFAEQLRAVNKEKGDLIDKLQVIKQSESQLLNDIKKLQVNNERVTVLCTNVTQEKLQMEQELRETTAHIELWNRTLADKMGIDRVELKDLVSLIDRFSGHSPDVETKEQRDADEVSLLLAASQKENETLQQQVTAMKDEIQRLNVDRDQMANNLDGMTIEINKLFENAEQLNKEVELAREAEAILKQEIRDLKKKSSDEGAVVVGSSVLSILKEGIVSNLVDLADTMPEYSKEFLEKLNAMLQGTDLRGDEGANIFVHYFNECLSQLKISLKENDILSKEVDHLNNSVKEHETLVANHNKDCERLRTELEELSSDSRQLLLDLSHLRHENSMRVTEIEDLMVRLRSKDEKCDKLEEDRRRESDSAEMKIRSLQKELEEAHAGMAKKTQEYEELKVRLHEMESSRKYLDDKRQVTSKLEHENEDLLKMLAEKEELLSGFEELKANDAGKLSEELHSAREELISKTAELKDSQAAIDALKDELNALRSKYHDKQCQRDAETQVDTETSVQENIEKLQRELDKMSEELSKTKRQLEESRTVKKDVKDLGKALKQQNSELEKAQRVLQEKANIEDELSHLKASHLKTMEELKNTNQRLEQSQQASKNLSQVEASLKNKSSELEKALWLLEERSAEKLAVSEELDKVKEELKSTVQQLQLSRSEGESVKRDAEEMHVTLEGVSKELDAARQDLRRKVELEEEVVRIQEALNESLKQMEKSQRENVLVNDKAQKLNLELESAASELKSAREKLLDVGKLAAEFEALKLQFVEIAEELQKAQELVEEGHAAKVEAEKLAVELDRVTQELERVRVELQNKESLEIEASALRKKLEEVTNDCQELKKLADVSGTAQTDAQKLASEVERLSGEVESAKKELEQKAELQRELGAANNQLQKTFDELSSLKKLIEDGDAIKSSLEKAVEEGAAVTESLRHENARFLETTERLQAENEVLSDKLSNQACAFNDELIKKNEEIRTLSSKIEEFQEMANFRKMELEDINCIWAGRLNSFKAILITLGRSLNELSLQSKELQQMFLEKLRSLNTVLTVNTKIVVDQAKNELLDEMHRMNKHLKDRGEAIEKLKNTLSETEGKLESATTQHNELVNENNKMMADLKTKEDKLVANEAALKELETEVGRLRELKEGPPESDVLSTSTISRSEDHMRLKEVDDSIEEKYIKLRQIAVKLKKRVAELTQALDQSKSGADKDLHEKIQHLSAVAKNAQKVQESYDKTLDELEECRKQNASLETTVKELRTANETLTSQVTALQSQCANVPMMQKQIEGLNATLKELKVEMNKLDMEKKVEVMKYKESKKQCTILEAEVGSLSQSLDQAVQQGRSHNVLELEMKNYEKVIADLTSQLNTEKQKLANSEKEFASVSLVKSGLEEQISLLDKQVKAEESRNVNVQDQLKSLKEKMSANQRQLDEVNSLLSEAKRELHLAKSLNEEQTLKMSSLTSEFSRKELDLLSRIDSFSAHIQSLEMSLATTKQELTTSNSEKEHLREEFENYRLRAQSMLARQKGDTISHGEKEARENLDKLKKELDGARQKMENTQTEIETLNNKLSSLQLEKARSDKRYEDVTKALHQKITDYDTLNTEYRAFKFSAETLLQNTKLEFEERGRLLNEEITRLKDLVDALNEEALRKSQMADEVRIDNAVEGHHLSDNIPSLLEREDGEGSESVLPPTGNFRRLSNLVPLDILLNNPIDDENRIPVLQEQIEKLHSELNSYDVRVKHLASLLSEAEKDSARSSQQNAVLKEELRRLERSLQREPHIANSEYLKNVIFKFLILQSGDERTRLVPVLDTILKLSPEETSRLNAVARGDSASWGSYLHSWTGL